MSDSHTVTEHTVTGANGIRLRAREWGDPSNSTVLFVHGYPDNSEVWSHIVDRLAGRFHVITYDVRGAGKSEAGESFGGYGLNLLVEDMSAVIDALAPRDRDLHLVAHDWGAIQSWEAVVTPAVASRLVTFTYFGAPSLDHASHWLRSLARPDVSKLSNLAAQLMKSWYIAAFQIPFAGQLLWRGGADRLFPILIGKLEGIPTADFGSREELQSDGSHGAEMYRANFIPKLLKPGEGRTDLPVQVIVAKRDPFVHPGIVEETARRVPRLTRREIDAGHWAQRSHPDEIARMITEFVES